MGAPVNNGVPSALKFHPLPQLEKEMKSIGSTFLSAPIQGSFEHFSAGAKRSFEGTDSSRNVKVKVSEEEGYKSEDAAGKKDRSGNYEWLVVYNPKITRSLTIGLVHSFTHESVVCAVKFNPAGTLLATGSNKVIYLYDVKSGEKIATLKDDEVSKTAPPEEDRFIRSICFSPDGKLMAAGSEDQVIRIWDMNTMKIVSRLSGHEQDIYSIEFFDNGKMLASGSGDRTVRLWDIKEEICATVLFAGSADSSKDSGITSIAVSPNGRFLAAVRQFILFACLVYHFKGSLDRLIRIWTLPEGVPVDVLEGHKDSVYSVAFDPIGKQLISGSLDKTIRVWEFTSPDDLQGAKVVHEMCGHKDFVLSVASSLDGRWILSGSKDRSVQCWDIATGSTHLMLQGHQNSVIGIAVSPSGNLFATASVDARARIWSLQPADMSGSLSASGQSSAAHSSSSLAMHRQMQTEDLEMSESESEED